MKKGFVIWLTGLPCSGKTTLGDKIKRRLQAHDIASCRLDGDIVRKGLTLDLGFSKEDRNENIRRVAWVSKLLADNGVNVIATFVSPYREVRDRMRKEIDEFIEVYVHCTKEECAKRDVKGMWAKALAGEIKDFTGVDDPYEQPYKAHVVVDTVEQDADTCTDLIMSYLDKVRYLS